MIKHNSRSSYDSKVYYFLLLIPLINTVSDSTINFFGREQFHLGLVRFGLIFVVTIFFLKSEKLQDNSVNQSIIFFSIYLFSLLFLSTNVFYSFHSGFLKWFTAFMMFPIGRYYFRDLEDLRQLSFFIILSSIPVLINYIYAQMFSIGTSAYLEDSFYYGGAPVGIVNSLALIVLASPLYLLLNKNKALSRIIAYVLIFLSILCILLVMKRSAIIGLTIGFMVYFLFTKMKKNYVKYLLILGILFYLSFGYIESILIPRFEARKTKIYQIENEGRYHEAFYALKEFDEGDIFHKLIGSEVFNSREYFGSKYFGRNRMIHGDFAMFFYGAGLIGIFSYLFIFYLMLKQIIFYHKIIKGNQGYSSIRAVFFSIIACYLFISLTGSGSIAFRTNSFLLLGALSGVSYFEMRKTIAGK